MDISKNIEQKLLFSGKAHQQLFQQLGAIDSFKGSWDTLELKDSRYLKELRKIATIESIGSSTRIEGATLTDEEVEKLLGSLKITPLSTREQQEVAGYYEALEVILQHFEDIEVSERYIHQLHSLLLKFSSKDQSHKGAYKTLSNQVVARYPDGTQRTIFKTTEPHLTAKEMQELITWLDMRLHNRDMHPVFITAVFVYEFLSIHPYQDGNGRLSRLLTTLLLMKQGYGFVQYVSFEHIIEERKEDYYRSLMEGQKNRGQKEEVIERWMLFFVDCLVTLQKRLEVKYAGYTKLSIELNDRQRQIVEYLKQNSPAQVSDVEAHLHPLSRNTIKKDLAYLVKEGLLLKTGERKGTRYHYKK